MTSYELPPSDGSPYMDDQQKENFEKFEEMGEEAVRVSPSIFAGRRKADAMLWLER